MVSFIFSVVCVVVFLASVQKKVITGNGQLHEKVQYFNIGDRLFDLSPSVIHCMLKEYFYFFCIIFEISQPAPNKTRRIRITIIRTFKWPNGL